VAGAEQRSALPQARAGTVATPTVFLSQEARVTLQGKLDAYQAQARAKRPAEWQAIMDRATEDLRRSDVAERSLKAGDRAPDFALPDATGRMVRSAELLAAAHLVVSFYRGGW
jgi:hypothetical protein